MDNENTVLFSSTLILLLLICFISVNAPSQEIVVPELMEVYLTPTPSPQQNNNPVGEIVLTYTGTNLLGVINASTPPSKWWIDREGIVIDAAVYHTSSPSVRLDATDPEGDNPDRECDSINTAISVGQHLYLACWLKTSASGMSYTYGGARIGIDFYDSHRITAIQYNPAGATPTEYEMNNQVDQWHDWNTDWSLMEVDLIVPSQMPSDGGYYPDEELHTPTSIYAWMQVWDSNGCINTGQAWFSDPVFYINPTTLGGTLPMPSATMHLTNQFRR